MYNNLQLKYGKLVPMFATGVFQTTIFVYKTDAPQNKYAERSTRSPDVLSPLPPPAAGLWGMKGLKWRAVYRDRWWGRPIRALAPQTCWWYRDSAGNQSTPQVARSSELLCCAGPCGVVGGICFIKTHLSSNKPQRWTGDETPHHKHIWLPSSLPALSVQPSNNKINLIRLNYIWKSIKTIHSITVFDYFWLNKCSLDEHKRHLSKR